MTLSWFSRNNSDRWMRYFTKSDLTNVKQTCFGYVSKSDWLNINFMLMFIFIISFLFTICFTDFTTLKWTYNTCLVYEKLRSVICHQKVYVQFQGSPQLYQQLPFSCKLVPTSANIIISSPVMWSCLLERYLEL